MIVPIIFDPYEANGYIFSANFSHGLEKIIASKKHHFMSIDGNHYREFDYNAFFREAPRLIIVRGTLRHWLVPALRFFREQKIDVLLIGDNPCPEFPVRGNITSDDERGTLLLLRHFATCGCSRTALYSIFENSTSDMKKQYFFLKHISQKDNPDRFCILNKTGLEACYRDFFSRISEFDSVICPNELAAVSLIRNLQNDGIRVPEDIQVAAFGGHGISRFLKKRLTAVDSKPEHITYNVVFQFFRMLISLPENSEPLKIVQSVDLDIHNTTLPKCSMESSNDPDCSIPGMVHTNFYDDDEVRFYIQLAQLFNCCDGTDLKMVHLCLKGYSYEKLAENLHMSVGTTFYRMQKILQFLGFDSRTQLEDFLRSHNFENLYQS